MEKESQQLTFHDEINLIRSQQAEKYLASTSKYRYKDYDKRAVRLTVYDRDYYECLECGALEELTLDHVIPKSKGGCSREENYQTLCRSCNQAKSDDTIDWRWRNGTRF